MGKEKYTSKEEKSVGTWERRKNPHVRERESSFAEEEIRNLLEHRKREGERVAARFPREGRTVQIVQQPVQ